MMMYFVVNVKFFMHFFFKIFSFEHDKSNHQQKTTADTDDRRSSVADHPCHEQYERQYHRIYRRHYIIYHILSW